MSEQNFFRNKEEELQRLTQEIADLKSTMKDMASSLTRIERHVKRSFGIAPKSKSSVKRGTSYLTPVKLKYFFFKNS